MASEGLVEGGRSGKPCRDQPMLEGRGSWAANCGEAKVEFVCDSLRPCLNFFVRGQIMPCLPALFVKQSPSRIVGSLLSGYIWLSGTIEIQFAVGRGSIGIWETRF